LPGRKKRLINLKKASSVGILFEVHDNETYQKVYDYIQQLHDTKIKVKVLGFVMEKHLALHFLPVLSFDYIYPKDLNWYGKPWSKHAQEFWSSDFDICINISSVNCYPLKYILCKSISSLKVGPYSEEDKEYYDILVQPEVNHDQVKFLRQVHDYLTILHPKENA
jgi:hypothetical protein